MKVFIVLQSRQLHRTPPQLFPSKAPSFPIDMQERNTGGLWGFLSPMNPNLSRIDFRKLKSKYSIGRRQEGENDVILPWPKISKS